MSETTYQRIRRQVNAHDHDYFGLTGLERDRRDLLQLVGRMRVILQVALTDCMSQGWDYEPEWMSKAAALIAETEEA